jgi:hypothetical protein
MATNANALVANIQPNKTRNIASMLGRLQRETAFDHTEAPPSFGDYWFKREDPRVRELEAEIAVKDAEIKQLNSTIKDLNISLKQEENAGQKERIRVDTKRGNLVKRTKYQWILNNTITETLSEKDAKYEQGMKYIQDMFDAFLEMPMEKIDNRKVEQFEGNTKFGLYQLLIEMRLGHIKTTVWRNGIETPGYELTGPMTLLAQNGEAEELCNGWTIYLTNRYQKIFMLIKRVEKVLTQTELRSMDKIVESINSFMRLFGVVMPKTSHV